MKSTEIRRKGEVVGLLMQADAILAEMSSGVMNVMDTYAENEWALEPWMKERIHQLGDLEKRCYDLMMDAQKLEML